MIEYGIEIGALMSSATQTIGIKKSPARGGGAKLAPAR
jgi:hypothetical protein